MEVVKWHKIIWILQFRRYLPRNASDSPNSNQSNFQHRFRHPIVEKRRSKRGTLLGQFGTNLTEMAKMEKLILSLVEIKIGSLKF